MQRFATWAYGLPKLTTVYDALGNKVKETEYQYDTTYAQEMIDDIFKGPPPANGVWSYLVSCKCLVERTASQRNTDWIKPEEYNANYQVHTVAGTLDVDFYPMYSGRIQLQKTIERVYRKGDPSQFVSTETEYLL